MNRYLLCRRLMAPAILLLLGIVALLNQAGVAGWDIFVPLLLILIGVIKLAERAALYAEPYPPYYPGAPNVPPPGMPPYPGQAGWYSADPARQVTQQAASQPLHQDEEKL